MFTRIGERSFPVAAVVDVVLLEDASRIRVREHDVGDGGEHSNRVHGARFVPALDPVQGHRSRSVGRQQPRDDRRRAMPRRVELVTDAVAKVRIRSCRGHVEHDPPGFGRSERRWLLPAFLILLIAVGIIVAGLLFRESRQPDTAGPTTSSTVAPAGPLPVASVSSYDPQGSGTSGENDALAARATDGDDLTAWRTETYDQPDFFGDKTGVGLVIHLAGRSRLENVRVSGSTNGWSGQVYVLDGGILAWQDQGFAVTQLTDARPAK